jgi:hypothetical protein
MHKLDPNNVKPCRHMESLVSAWVDGKLTGIARWYTELHVKGCPQCQSSLPFLRTLNFRLSALAQKPVPEKLSDARWQAVETAWAQSEAQAGAATEDPA